MTLIDRPRLQVLVADRDVTERCDSIVFSATDKGGFEIATLGLPSSDRPKKGTPITIRQGLEVAWWGRVAEISDHSQHGRATKTTGCEGWRALMRDQPFSMVYIDRDLGQWTPPIYARQIDLFNANHPLQGSSSVAPDAAGNPQLVMEIDNDWVSPNVPHAEVWYDAGPGNLINLIEGFAAGSNDGSVTWNDQVALCADQRTTTATTANMAAGGTVALLAGPYRYAAIFRYYTVTPAGVAGSRYMNAYKWLHIMGNHGLGLRLGASGLYASGDDGFYPSDIARHALSQCSGISAGTIVDSIGYVAPHVVYRTPTAADVIVDDMAKLMGWPWGVWEPSTIFGTQPRLDFRPPPTDATAVVSKAECDQLDITSRLGDLYNVCQVTYTDPAKGVGVATVTLPNAQLIEAGIADRTLLLDMGPGSLGSATTFGQFALALSQVAARAAGQATLPVSVRLPYGGSKPACLLRPGIDRLRIIDLVDGGPMLDIGTVRRDVFRISRVETSVARDGSLSTRAELDSGSNLLETLQARLSLGAGVVGSGASGG